MWEQNKRFSVKAKYMKNCNWVFATELSPSNFTKAKTLLELASKNFAKILIYLSVYISLYSRIVASKIFNKLRGINVGFSPSREKHCFDCFNENLLKLMKITFSFTLKAFFFLKIKFLS